MEIMVKIKLEGKEPIELSPEEVNKLREQLDSLGGFKETPYPYPLRYPYYPSYPYWDGQPWKITSGYASTDDPNGERNDSWQT